MDETLAMMQELTEAHGVPGQEDEVRALMRRYLLPYGELLSDGLGSLAVRWPGAGDGPRVLLAGHMDEVGFLVTSIDDDGYIHFQPLGGWWEQVVLAQRVRIRTRCGVYTGVIGSKPPHILGLDERKRVVEGRNLFIDIGVTNRREALAAGVRPGDPITPLCPFTVMANPKVLMAKAWDDRAGCALVVETLRLLAADGPCHPNVVYAGGTVQEEIGLRGATTLAHLIEPAIGIAYDVGIAGDTPGVTPYDAQGRLGRGALIFIYDGSLVPNPRLRDLVVDTAEAEGIPYQFDTMAGGGEDAGRMALSRAGMPAICLGVPARYIHSAASLIHRDDFDAAAHLGAALIRRLDAATVAALRA
jgi:endoglucanase